MWQKTDPIEIDTSQLDLDLGDYYSTDNNSTVTLSGTNILDSLSSDSFTLNTNWDTSYNDCITIGGQTLTERKLQPLDGLQEWQEEVNKKLAILQPNSELEEQWSELRELRERYVELEKELIEKNKVWAILKDTQKDIP
tara:strand:- start:1161 stop:1577 length:417 start_codon:yes stop_codon:yes gene_type:complete